MLFHCLEGVAAADAVVISLHVLSTTKHPLGSRSSAYALIGVSVKRPLVISVLLETLGATE